MEVFEVSFRDVPRSPAVDRKIRQQVERLQRLCDDMIGCRVAVERPQKHQRTGNPFRVRIEVSLPPEKRLIVRREPTQGDMHEPLHAVIGDAFRAMERRLKETSRRRRGDVKTHDEPRALVIRLFPEKGYGFIKTLDDRDLYFHENAVLHGHFERLAEGTEVRFEESTGRHGPQASSVQIVSKPGKESSPRRRAGVPRGWR